MSVQAYGINHIALEVGDAQAAVAFYADVFGVTLLSGGEGAAWCQLGEHQFMAFFEVTEVRIDRARHFGIIVRDEGQIAEVRDKLTQTYGITLEPHFRCDFRDPWGNRIQVVDLHDESLVWLLPYREVEDAGITFREPPDVAKPGAPDDHFGQPPAEAA